MFVVNYSEPKWVESHKYIYIYIKAVAQLEVENEKDLARCLPSVSGIISVFVKMQSL